MAIGAIQRMPEPVKSAQPVPEQFPGLKLGHLLGKGSYGRVYRGTWRGEIIAAKVLAQMPSRAVPCLLPGSCLVSLLQLQ